MVAIVNRRPKTLGLLEMLDAFIVHNKEVITKRTRFDLDHAGMRKHIVDGFIKALSILDEIIKIIRKSKDKEDSILNLINAFEFSRLQSEAIVNMQLYKLSNTDVTQLEKELEYLITLIKELSEILENDDKFKNVMKSELREIKKEYANSRRTLIKDEVSEIVIDEVDLVSKDDYIICVSSSGYIKKISLKSFNTNSNDTPGLKEGDYIEALYKLNNLDTLILFTNKGNYLYLPVRNIGEFKYKDIGSHISNWISIPEGEIAIKSLVVSKSDDFIITAFTKLGMVKKMNIKDFDVSRYSKPITMFKLKENDELLSVSLSCGKEVVLATKTGYVLKYDTSEIPIVGLKTSGVKSIKLTDKDEVVGAFVLNPEKEYLTIFTDKNTAKRIKISDIFKTSRAKKGSKIINSPKSKIYSILKCFNSSSKTIYGLIRGDMAYIKSSDINIMDKNSVGSVISKKNITDVFKVSALKVINNKDNVIKNTEEIEKLEDISSIQKEVKEKKLTMSDFFDEFKL